jgi:uncharacterized protein YfkK (UPF0435 family)
MKSASAIFISEVRMKMPMLNVGLLKPQLKSVTPMGAEK